MKIKKEAERKFGSAFNPTRKELGMHLLPNNWKVIYNEEYSLYFGEKENTDDCKGYVYKIIEYDKKLNIVSEEDFYRPIDSTKKPSVEDCDDTHFSVIYSFADKDYRFNSECCDECGKVLAVPWENTKKGNQGKILELLDKAGIPGY